jgi:hypothetical protein
LKKRLSDEREEQTDDPTYTDVRKQLANSKKHKASGIDGITTELIHKAGLITWNRIYKLIKQVHKEEEA